MISLHLNFSVDSTNRLRFDCRITLLHICFATNCVETYSSTYAVARKTLGTVANIRSRTYCRSTDEAFAFVKISRIRNDAAQ